MKITRKNENTDTTLEKFAEANGLELTVTTYSWGIAAQFKGWEVSKGGLIGSDFGRGHTEEIAIEDYRKNISGQKIVRDAWLDSRKEIYVPTLLSVS